MPEPDPANRLRQRPVVGGEPPDAGALPAGCAFHPRCPVAIAGTCDRVVPPLVELGRGHQVACHLYPAGERLDGAGDGTAGDGAGGGTLGWRARLGGAAAGRGRGGSAGGRLDDLERGQDAGVLGLRVVEPVGRDLHVRRHALALEGPAVGQLEAEGDDLQQRAVREVDRLRAVRLARRLGADDGGAALVLEDGRELLGIGLGGLVHEHDDRHVGVVVGQVAGLDLDGLVAGAGVEGAHLARDEGPQRLQDDARGALVGAAQVDDEPLERLVADEARERLLDAVDGLLAGEGDDAQVADPGCRLQAPRLRAG